MLKKILVLVFVCSAFAATAQGANPQEGMVLKNYHHFKKLFGDDFKLYIHGAGQTLEFTTGLLAHRGERVLYCPPANMGLNADNFMSIIDKEVALSTMDPSTPLPGIMLAGLVRTFPCQR